MHWLVRIAGAILAIVTLTVTSALADDWVATKLRGSVVQLVGSEWLPLERYDVVPDDRVIRTLVGAHVTFQRDEETIELAPNTQIRIHDREGQRFTVVEEHFGVVTVEAEVQNVQHFAVQTPYLAAVVKGTKFVVTSDEAGGSVEVLRGAVAVEAVSDRSKTIVKAGQTASVSAAGLAASSASNAGAGSAHDLVVTGGGTLPDVLSDTEDLVDDTGNLVDDVLDGVLNGHDDNGNHGDGDNGNHGDGDNGNHTGLVRRVLNGLL